MQVTFLPADSLSNQDVRDVLTEIQKQLQLGATAGNVKISGSMTNEVDVATEGMKCRAKWTVDGDIDA